MKSIALRLALALTMCPAIALCQLGGQPVNQVDIPPPQAVQTILDFAGGNNLTYIGKAVSDQGERGTSTIAVSAASNANPVSFTATAHGMDFQTGAPVTPGVCISGGTANWTVINGCWIATPTSANAFTIPVDSSALGALTGTLVVTTRCPLITKSVWAIQKLSYDTSNRVVRTSWASLPAGAGSATPVPAGNVAMQFIWANRASLAYQ